MPAYLPPLTRRRFLASTLLALCGAGCRTSLGTQARKTTNSWILFSDTHIAEDPSFVTRNVNVSRNLQMAVEQARSLPLKPDGVIINGDCAYGTGQTGDYLNFTKLLQPLREDGLPIHISLGNHDNRDRFREILRVAKGALPTHHVSVVESPLANWFILDSLEQTNVTPGFLGDEQLAWLEKELDARSSRPALIVIHHNPGIGGNMGLKDTVRLFEIMRPRRQVKAYIYGHTHTWKLEQDTSGIHLVNLPPVAYAFKESDPSGWVSAQLRPDAMTLKFYSLTPGHNAHNVEHHLPYRTA